MDSTSNDSIALETTSFARVAQTYPACIASMRSRFHFSWWRFVPRISGYSCYTHRAAAKPNGNRKETVTAMRNGKSKLADAHPETTHSTATGAKAGELRDARACAFGGGMHEKHPNPGMRGPTHPGAGCVWFLSGPARGCTRLFVFGGAMRGCCVAYSDAG